MSKYTTQFLERLFLNLPPLVPEKISVAMEAELDELFLRPQSIAQVEDIIIGFQREVWPYTQAFEEIVKRYVAEMGETLLLRKASYGLRRAYEQYRKQNNWVDLYKGEAVSAFTPEERAELHELLVDIMCDVRAFARQAALSTDRKQYEARINHYRERLKTIEHELNRLRDLAAAEEHPALSREIRQHVRDLELGIAALGPAVDFEAVCNAHDHFVGRKKELNVRGMLWAR